VFYVGSLANRRLFAWSRVTWAEIRGLLLEAVGAGAEREEASMQRDGASVLERMRVKAKK
jgi:hypothetical protein